MHCNVLGSPVVGGVHVLRDIGTWCSTAIAIRWRITWMQFFFSVLSQMHVNNDYKEHEIDRIIEWNPRWNDEMYFHYNLFLIIFINWYCFWHIDFYFGRIGAIEIVNFPNGGAISLTYSHRQQEQSTKIEVAIRQFISTAQHWSIPLK